MATRLSKLWGMTEAHLAHINLPPPFWAFVWPGAHGMACYLRDHPNTVANKPVVDLACGSGVLAILALQHGATTATAIDIDPVACTAAHLNAEISLATDQQAQLQVKLMDATTYFPPVPAVVLAGDVCYHQPMASQMILHLRRLQAAGHTVLLADPGRRYRPKSDQTARGCYTVQTDIDIEDEHQKTVCIYHLHADIPPS
jgi:predicted nicotinamide N-methyase